MKTKNTLTLSLLFFSVISFAGTINPYTISSKQGKQHGGYQIYSGDVVMKIRSGTSLNIVSDSTHLKSDSPNTVVYEGNVEVTFPLTTNSNQIILITSEHLTVMKESTNGIKLTTESLVLTFTEKPDTSM